jgi:hypothetical protein
MPPSRAGSRHPVIGVSRALEDQLVEEPGDDDAEQAVQREDGEGDDEARHGRHRVGRPQDAVDTHGCRPSSVTPQPASMQMNPIGAARTSAHLAGLAGERQAPATRDRAGGLVHHASLRRHARLLGGDLAPWPRGPGAGRGRHQDREGHLRRVAAPGGRVCRCPPGDGTRPAVRVGGGGAAPQDRERSRAGDPADSAGGAGGAFLHLPPRPGALELAASAAAGGP